MPKEFSKQISGFKSFDDAADALEQRLRDEYGQSGFAYWTFAVEAFDPKSRRLDPENYPVHVTLRGPTYLKVAEMLYMNHRSYKEDETMIASCERNEPFSSWDILGKKPPDNRKTFDVLNFFNKFKITNDCFFPFHTQNKYQVLWTFELGGSREDRMNSDKLAKMQLLAARFMIAVSEYNISKKADLSDNKMSVREYQCLLLVARGYSNEKVAKELSISPDTAKFHISNIMRKLGTNSRAETVAKAARSGWLTN